MNIELRAWVLDDKKMVYQKEFSLIEFLKRIENDMECSSFILMLYLGFNDAYGKKIFDGDIVECQEEEEEDYYPMRGYDGKTRFLVSPTFPRLWLKGEKFGWEGELLIDPDSMKVIGNIYENPELLENLV